MRGLKINWRMAPLLVATLVVFAAGALLRTSLFALDLPALEQRAASGDAEALFQLADIYERGDQVEQDLGLAAQLLQAAAERDHASAQYRLGLAQAAGVGTERDPVQSYVWLILAARDGGVTSLLAKSLQEVVQRDLAAPQLAEAEARAAAFAPVAGPLDLPRPADGKAVAGGGGAPLPETNCGRLEVASGSDGQARVAGLVASGSPTAAEVERALAATLGRPFDLQLIEVAPVLCTVVEDLTNDSAKSDARLALELRNAEGATKDRFQEEEHLVIELAPQDEARHVYLDYFTHEGEVLHLLPGSDYPDNFVPAGASLVLGDPQQGQPVWQIGPPFGQDLLVALAARRPLYQDRRPDVEDIEPYLAFLRDRLASLPPEDPVRMAYRVVESVPR
jgi:TPR repeat protein